MCTPLPACSGSSSGVKLARIPRRRATSRTTSLSTIARSALASPSAGATGISNWCGAYSAKNRSGCDAGLLERGHHAARANGSMRRSASSENGSAGGRVGSSSWNSCSKLATTRAPSSSLELAQRLAQEGAAGSTPTAVRRSRRCRRCISSSAPCSSPSPSPSTRTRACRRVRQQAQVAGRAERVRLGERAERCERVVGGHPADRPRAGTRRAPRRAPRARARSRRGRSTRARPARRRSRRRLAGDGAVVPDALVEADRGRAGAHGVGVVRGGDHEHAACRHVAALERRASRSCGCM